MNFDKVDKKSIAYSILYKYAKFAHDKIFYKKVIYHGLENIPENKPILIAPNHQNALMDAFAVLFSINRKTVFLARSDIFQNPVVAQILLFLRILPVYRIRDGKEKLKLNDTIYDKTVDVLEKNIPIGIFPEATHNEIMHIQTLKKGVQRVTLLTQAKHENQIDVKIIPAGIFYSNYFNFRSVLHVYYDKPISVSKYYEQYLEHEAKAMVSLGDEMFDRLLNIAVDVRDTENYDVYKALMQINLPDKISEAEKFISIKQSIKIVENISTQNPDKFDDLCKKTREYSQILSKFRLKDWVLRKKISFSGILSRSFIALLGFPLFLLGFINNIIPYFIPSLITGKIKDPQFISSVRFGLSVFLFPVYYLLFFVIAGAISGYWLYSLVYVIFMPVTGLAAFLYHRFFVKFSAKLRFRANSQNPDMNRLLNLRKEILEIVNEKNA